MDLRLLRLGVVGVLLAPYAAVLGQGLSTVDFVKGNYGKYASVLKLSDLPDDYSAVKLSVSASGSDPLASLWPLLGLGAHVGNQAETNAKYRLAQCYWTNGDTVRAVNREFLVTYKLDVELLEAIAQNSTLVDGGEPKAKAPEPSLKINLVALDSIQSVAPCPDLTKKDLLKSYGNPDWQITPPMRTESQQTSTVSNVKQVALGMIMYTNDWDDYCPYPQSSKAAWYVEYPYVKNINVFKTLNPKGGMIRFNMGIAGASTTSIASPADTVLLFESEPWPDGRRVVAFCDGHVKLVNEQTWADLSKHLTPSGIARVKKPLPVSYDKEFDKLVAQRAEAKNGG